MRPISARSVVARREPTQDDARSLCTVKAGTATGILESLTANLGSPRPDGASGASLGKTVRTKRRNEACPLDPECFVQLTTSRKHWPHINAIASTCAASKLTGRCWVALRPATGAGTRDRASEIRESFGAFPRSPTLQSETRDADYCRNSSGAV